MSSQDVEQDYLPHSESFLRSLLWQDTRLDLIRDILAHPKHKPSLSELDFVNEFAEPEEVRFQLSMLVEYGILERVKYEGDSEIENAPNTFYTLTDDGWATIRYFNEQFSQDMYNKLSEMYSRAMEEAPESVKLAGDAPRPSGESGNE